MKRKTFIATASVVLIGLPVAYYFKSRNNTDPIATPDFLSNIFDEPTLRSIGMGYRSRVPGVDEKQKLTNLILADSGSDKKLKITDRAGIRKLVKKKIHEDFIMSKTIVINGWEISITEARQCAIFSLS